ncbi:unnamed protein product [Lactuca saligna]|uniref:Upstream activation factor subunit spp27 n=1 Tax=Lactuca saligna TaxID=75948 RepID=A0AA36E896_LACSI|nr:unnamed protein product [Lactuca saligna]
MLTDSELLERLHHVLRTSDLDTATPATVRRKMEQDLGIDLSDRKPYIRQQIDLYLEFHYTNDNPEGDAEESGNAKVEETVNGGSTSKEGDDDQEEEESDAGTTEIDIKHKKKGGGFSKPCALSPQLQKFTGESEMARTEVVKKIWAYIKEKDLQNPANKRKILCDEMLHELFRVKSIDMFKMNKALSKHIWPIEEEHETPVSVKPLAKKKQNKRVKEDEEEQKEKKQKTKSSGFVVPLPMSEALVQFFGTGEIELSRSEVVKRIWEYIKRNDLQDPSDKRRILCDDKLKELFKLDTFIGFTVTKLLSPHFIKQQK